MSQGPPQPPPGPAPNMFDFGSMGMQDMNGIGVRLCSTHSFQLTARSSPAPAQLPHSSLLLFFCSKLCFLVASAAHERPETDLDRPRCSTKCISSLQLQLQPPARGSGDRPLQLPPACAPVFTLALCLVFMSVSSPLNVWLTQTPLSPADDRQPRHDGAPR